MPDTDKGGPADDPILHSREASLLSAALRWLLAQDKTIVLLALILCGVGTGVWVLGRGVLFGVPEWLAGIRAGYKEAITEFRVEAKEQRDLHQQQFDKLTDTFRETRKLDEERYQKMVDLILKNSFSGPTQTLNLGYDREKLVRDLVDKREAAKSPPPVAATPKGNNDGLQP